MTQPQPFGDILGAWKKATDDYLATWGKTFEQLTGTDQAAEAQREATKTFLGAQAAMSEQARQVWGPMIEAAGAVPITEFRRLMDQVQTVLLRLDRIDDALRDLKAANPAPGKRKARKKAGEE
ncbi:MAG: hypothetical protein HY875_17365 [Chloroflexi bacterium]|nr:hypothetical protein [Chloroflexota bacterium]